MRPSDESLGGALREESHVGGIDLREAHAWPDSPATVRPPRHPECKVRELIVRLFGTAELASEPLQLGFASSAEERRIGDDLPCLAGMVNAAAFSSHPTGQLVIDHVQTVQHELEHGALYTPQCPSGHSFAPDQPHDIVPSDARKPGHIVLIEPEQLHDAHDHVDWERARKRLESHLATRRRLRSCDRRSGFESTGDEEGR